MTVRSAITSRRADCVLGEARLISSARTTFAKIWTGVKLELAVTLVVDSHAGDIAGQ